MLQQQKAQAAEAPRQAETAPPAPRVAQPAGNAAQAEAAPATGAASAPKVTGPLGRVWNRILRKADTATDTAGAKVSAAQVQAYLDSIGFAEGEFFRGTKLEKAAESLLTQFDKDSDGALTWEEFQGFAPQLLAMLSTKGPDEAPAQHAATDKNRDGAASLGELQAANKARLPKDTEHADLVAQLGARVAVDAVDTDQRQLPVAQRTLSQKEWSDAARELKP